jgi:single-stranded-DNA-specific exonuclease
MSTEAERVWSCVEVDEARVSALASELSVPLPIARVLVSRGIADLEAASSFLTPRLSALSDPFRIPDMKPAVERIWQALDSGERITVFGDYDADGVTSCALLTLVLRRLGAMVEHFLPSRHDEGYGLTPESITKTIDKTDPALIISVDCGTNSVDAVALATERGVDVIVTDHHECEGTPPAAVAVVNPKLGDFEDTQILAGVGVAFKLCHALAKYGNDNEYSAVKGLDLREYLDLVALGTVADVMPLVGENRTLVRHGLLRIKEAPRCGLQALIRVAKVRTEVDCYHLGFLIGPRINAAGRLDSPEPALQLLMSEDLGIAKRLAGRLDSANRERKQIEERIVVEAVEELDTYFDADKTFGIVVGRESWHVGTIGIVASRICRRYNRPAVIIAFDADGMGKGSCRSVGSINLIEALRECSDTLEQCGGHKMAAGLSIKRENLDAFREQFSAACHKQATPSDLVGTHVIDSWITLGEADKSLISAINTLRPLGHGNATPVWGSRNVSIVGQPRVVGKNHLKLVLASGGTQLDAIAFGMAGRELYKGGIDILFNVQENSYMGRTSVQLVIKDFRASRGG